MATHQTQIGLDSILGENWEGKTLLDVGCGSGKLSLKVILQTKPDKFFGVDINPQKINMAKKIFTENNIDNSTFYLTDSSDLAMVDSSSMDVVFCNIAFQQFKDKLGSLKEMYRVLKTGGKAIINAIEEKTEVLKKMEQIAKIEADKGNKMSKKEFDKLAKTVGFSLIETVSKEDKMVYPSVEKLLDNYQRFEVIFPKLAFLPKEKLYNLWKQLKTQLISNSSQGKFIETWKIFNAKLTK